MHKARGHILAIFTILLWGITFISTKILLLSFSPFEILFIRFFIGWLALFLLYPHALHMRKQDKPLFMGAGFSGVTLYFLLENIALKYTTASNTAIIVSLAPFFTALLASVVIKLEHLYPRFFIGFIVAFIGIVLVSSKDLAFESSPLGDFLALLAAIAWAFYSIFTRKIGALSYNNLAATRAIFLYGLLFMLPVFCVLPFNIDMEIMLAPINLLNILFLGIGASAICFATWNYAINILGVIQSSLYIYLVPVVTIVAAFIYLDERMTPLMIIGALMTLCGLLIGETRLPVKSRQKNN